jgi:hypothetical protein
MKIEARSMSTSAAEREHNDTIILLKVLSSKTTAKF